MPCRGSTLVTLRCQCHVTLANHNVTNLTPNKEMYLPTKQLNIEGSVQKKLNIEDNIFLSKYAMCLILISNRGRN